VIYVQVHVDDTLVTASSRELCTEFVAAWALEFRETVDVSELSENFVGVRTHRVSSSSVELTCGATIDNLADLVRDHPVAHGVSLEYPVGANAPSRLRAGASLSCPLVPALVPLARQIVGTLSWIAGVRFDVLFAARLLARYATLDRLTTFAWAEMLRAAHFVVASRDLPLVLTAVPAGAQLTVWTDSSLANAWGGRSWGGSCAGYPGSGALFASSSAPPDAAESSGVVELHQAVLAIKASLGVRILLREFGVPPAGPTVVYTDAKVVVDAALSERVSQEAKWVAPRYAMIRRAQVDGAIEFVQVLSAENRADIFTKPLVGQAFILHQHAVLGLPSPASSAPLRGDAAE
jgi:hypothetical protein